jgi:hypothetical protein
MFYLALQRRSGGTTRSTIDFGAANYRLLDGYFPEASTGDNPITESFNIMLTGASADLADMARGIDEALVFAKAHPDGPDGVWVLFSPDEAVEAWQSRLSGGALTLDNRLQTRWKNARLRAQVIIERQPFWEAVDPVTLELENRAGTGQTAIIVNHRDADATDDLHVRIADDQVEGGLPAPAVIEYTNTTNNAALVNHLMVGHFATSLPHAAPLPSILMFEGVGNADANCSGGAYDDLGWADEVENQMVTWGFDPETFRQRNYKMVARLRDVVAYTDLWLKLKILSGTTILSETRWTLVEAGKSLVSIGSLKIPPFKHGIYISMADLTLALYEKRAGGAGAMNLDFITALPQDGWRKYEAISGLAYNETLIDDPVSGILYTSATGGNSVTHLVEEGEPLMLMPGVNNVLYFLHDIDDDTAPIARTAQVVVKYHPRRRTV